MTLKGDENRQLKKLANKIGNTMVQAKTNNQEYQGRNLDNYFDNKGEVKKSLAKEIMQSQSEMNFLDKIETFEELGWSDPDLEPKAALKKSIDWLR